MLTVTDLFAGAGGSSCDITTQIGNAVVPAAARDVATVVTESLGAA